MSGGLCPSKSTVYVSNIPFSLTNNDLHKIMEKYGKVVKVTIVKDKDTHKSKGVAFVLFLERESAYKCVRALNHKELFGRTLKCSIAKDNGRATEFIRKKFYFDKSQCYECGEVGHLSYFCPNNLLGDREPEKKKKKKRFRTDDELSEEDQSDEEMGEDPALESLSAVIKEQQEKIEQERRQMNYGETGIFSKIKEPGASADSSVVDEQDATVPHKKKKYKKSDYFSDEEEVEEGE